MATAVGVRQIRAWVEKDDDEESVEGQYYAPAENLLTFAPSDQVCPFCRRTMTKISAPIFGRICKDEQKRDRDGKASAIVDLLPPTHDAFSCSDCDRIFTSIRNDA